MSTNTVTLTDVLPETYVEGFHDEDVIRKMKYRKLVGCPGKNKSEDMLVSILSLGTSSIGGVFRGDTNDDECIELVIDAIRAGINLIDCAAWYGHGKSEVLLGKALARIPREAYYIQTKCGRYEPDILHMFDFSAEKSEESINTSLERLGCGYLDCIQVHDPEYAQSIQQILEETLPTLDNARKEGKARMVGITGFPLSIQKEIILKSPIRIDTSLSYCHYCLHDTSLLDTLPFFRKHGIVCMNAAPVSMGLLTARGPPSWHPAQQPIRDACRNAQQVCERSGVDFSKLALHFCLAEESIPTTFVSTASRSRLQENIDVVYNLGNLTDVERSVLEEIRRDIFEPLNNLSWEGIEVADYHDKYSRALNGEQVGTLSTN